MDMVSSLNGMLADGLHLQDILKKLSPAEQAKEALNALNAQAITVDLSAEAMAASAASSNLMANNFLQVHGADESRYLNAAKNAYDNEQAIQNAKGATLAGAFDEFIGDAVQYANRRTRQARMLKDALKSHEKVFKELRDNIEAQAEEALNTSPVLNKDGTVSAHAITKPSLAPEGAPAPTPDAESNVEIAGVEVNAVSRIEGVPASPAVKAPLAKTSLSWQGVDVVV